MAANCAGDLFRLPGEGGRVRWRRLRPDTAWAGDERCTGGGDNPTVQLSDSTHLFYYEGYFVAEIARLLGKSEDVIRTRLHRGRGMLREGLEGDEEHV